jgi:hypothetical protein
MPPPPMPCSPDLADASAITIVSANAATSPQAGGGSGCLRLRKGTKPSKAPKDGEVGARRRCQPLPHTYRPCQHHGFPVCGC